MTKLKKTPDDEITQALEVQSRAFKDRVQKELNICTSCPHDRDKCDCADLVLLKACAIIDWQAEQIKGKDEVEHDESCRHGIAPAVDEDGCCVSCGQDLNYAVTTADERRLIRECLGDAKDDDYWYTLLVDALHLLDRKDEQIKASQKAYHRGQEDLLRKGRVTFKRIEHGTE